MFATSEQSELTALEKFAIAPSRQSILNNPEAQKVISWVKALPSIYKTESFRPRIPQEPQLENITDVFFSKILGGQLPMSIKSLQDLAQQWNKVLAGSGE